MGVRCPACEGRRGLVIARVLVVRKSPYGEWKYLRYTHRVKLLDGKYKRKYCYNRIATLA